MKLLRLFGIISFSLGLAVIGGSNVCAMPGSSIDSSSAAASSSTSPEQKVCAICQKALADKERLPIAPCGHEIKVHSACLNEHPQLVLCSTCKEPIPEACSICAALFTERASNGQTLPRATKLLNCRHGLSFHEDCVFQALTIDERSPQRCPLCFRKDAINARYFDRLLHGNDGGERALAARHRGRDVVRLRERIMLGAEAGLGEIFKILAYWFLVELSKAYVKLLGYEYE